MNIDFQPQEPAKRKRAPSGHSEMDSPPTSLTGHIYQVASLLREHTPPPRPPPTKTIAWSADEPPSLKNQIEVIARILKNTLGRS
jgi:hypothetical protein